MQALTFYLAYPLIYLVSKSPFWLMYKISDLLYFFIYVLFGYRKKVVYSNLRGVFPEKSEKDIESIARSFYKYLCDLILESLKTIAWDEKAVNSRMTFNNTALLEDLYQKGKSILIVMGHLGNWEWAGPCFSLNNRHQLYVVYYPLTNPYFEKVMARARTKFNTKIVPKKDTLRSMVANRKTRNATALIADQAPTPVNTALWIKFLGKDTAVFTGPEKIAKKMDQAVVYMDVSRIKRGYYEVTPHLLFENPKETADHEITIAFNRILEQGIIKRPETWLWSHRRWKHNKPSNG